MKYNKQELEDLIFNQKLSYREIGRQFGVTDAAIKKACRRHGIDLPIRKTFPIDFIPHNKNKKKPKPIKINLKKKKIKEVKVIVKKEKPIPKPKFTIDFCVTCKNEYRKSYKNLSGCCSQKCYAGIKSNKLYQNFLSTIQFIYNPNYSPKYKSYFLKEQNNLCAICSKPNEWENKILVFVLDHIDGDAGNNMRENLRLVCPNCDSQLDTFKSKNKNSARNQKRYGGYKTKI